MQAVIVSFDSLATSSLGCYGNEWVETPHLDRLAASGITFDQHFADTVGASAGMAWASGLHALLPSGSAPQRSLGSWLQHANVASQLIVAGELTHWNRSAGFDVIQTISGQQSKDLSPDQVPFANLVKAGLASWNEKPLRNKNRLLWLHSAGPGIPPAGFDDLYFEDFEERGQQVENLSQTDKAAHPAVYAGAVSLIDHWIGELMNGIEDPQAAEPTLIIVMSLRGDDGQHLDMFQFDSARTANCSLYDQRIRCPLVMRVKGTDRFKDYSGYRVNHLAQTCDLIPTLLEWYGIETPALDNSQPRFNWFAELEKDNSSRSSLWISDETRFDAIRTSKWLCIRDRTAATNPETMSLALSSGIALFEKPEDLWDVSDVASQYADTVVELQKHFPRN